MLPHVFKVFDLTLESAKLYASFGVDVRNLPFKHQLSFGIFTPNFGAQTSLSGSCNNVACSFSVNHEVVLYCHTAALCNSVLQNGAEFGPLSGGNRVITDCSGRNC
jgi:hypothetical protein